MIAAILGQWRLWLILAAVAGAGWCLHLYGKHEYRAGQAQVQAKWDAASAQAAAQVAQAKQDDASAAQTASQTYQKEQANAKPIYKVIRQEVVRTVPVTQPCLSDGLRQSINAAIAGQLPASAASR